jgi:hypothetical protein
MKRSYAHCEAQPPAQWAQLSEGILSLPNHPLGVGPNKEKPRPDRGAKEDQSVSFPEDLETLASVPPKENYLNVWVP